MARYRLDEKQLIENIKLTFSEDLRKKLAPVLEEAAQKVVEDAISYAVAHLMKSVDIVIRPAMDRGKELVVVIETTTAEEKRGDA